MIVFVFIVLALSNLCQANFVHAAYVPEASDRSHARNRIALRCPSQYRFGLDWKTVAQRLTDVILFSIEPTSSGDLMALQRISDETMRVAREACRASGARLLVSVGGGGRSHNFAALATFQTSRLRFASALASFALKHDLDGVDIDWEARARDDASGANAVRLFRDVAAEFAKQSSLRGRPPSCCNHCGAMSGESVSSTIADSGRLVAWPRT